MKVAILYRDFSFLHPTYKNANSIRPIELKRFLDKNGCDTQLFNLGKRYFGKYPWMKMFLMKRLERLGFKEKGFLLKRINMMSDIIEKDIIKKNSFDLIIAEDFFDAYVFTRDLDCITLFDGATPCVDELRYSGKFTEQQISDLREIELEIYESSTYVAFHWETYKNYIKKYVYSGKNLITLNWGCHPKTERASFSSSPELVFLGKLNGYWIDLKLLAKLSRSLPEKIDIYGFPKPSKTYKLNFKGYANGTGILNQYQFGLVAIVKNSLMKEGFAAKHLEYISYGLPVFVPDWRRNLDLIRGSIPFNEDNFLEKIEIFSDRNKWEKMSELAYEQAKDLDWDNTLENLNVIIQN